MFCFKQKEFPISRKDFTLESGALDHSAILTVTNIRYPLSRVQPTCFALLNQRLISQDKVPVRFGSVRLTPLTSIPNMVQVYWLEDLRSVQEFGHM
ncbi:hypothetical protein DPEC_G00224800 [Dallia pectoralis]|uniref:Uncharacterized protein n=1 Tax=Dallia pectoralis TaxID=75939 RepID=A0ACC2G0E5_DALPE|nr:hypothetical protein DPEC_G00224800 [Dallia pectoralis]